MCVLVFLMACCFVLLPVKWMLGVARLVSVMVLLCVAALVTLFLVA